MSRPAWTTEFVSVMVFVVFGLILAHTSAPWLRRLDQRVEIRAQGVSGSSPPTNACRRFQRTKSAPPPAPHPLQGGWGTHPPVWLSTEPGRCKQTYKGDH